MYNYKQKKKRNVFAFSPVTEFDIEMQSFSIGSAAEDFLQAILFSCAYARYPRCIGYCPPSTQSCTPVNGRCGCPCKYIIFMHTFIAP